MNNQQQIQQATDDPGGDGWAWVAKGDIVREGDMWRSGACSWCRAERVGETVQYNAQYRRRIEQQQPSGSEPENAELQQLREQLRDLTRQAQLDAVELQQLREQVATLTQERDRQIRLRVSQCRNQLAGAIEHSSAPEAQAQLVDRLQAWLRPVLELVAENPEDASPLAVAVLGFLPGIASRLIEE